MTVEDRVRKANSALGELGSAWRGDWSDFDGRTLRHQLDEWGRVLVAALDPHADLDTAIAHWRIDAGLCAEHPGQGHWERGCGW